MVINFCFFRKTYLASAIAHYVHSKGQRYVATSHLGTNAAMMNGLSLYSFLGIWTVKCKMENIPNLPIDSNTKRRMHNLKLIIIDEISLVSSKTTIFNYTFAISNILFFIQCGARLLAATSLRMMKVTGSNQPFSGCYVLALGDFFQGLCIGDVSLHKRPEQLGVNDLFGREGCRLFHSGITITLKGNMRSKDDPPFANLLNNIRNKACAPNDLKLLSTRFESVLSQEERDSFKHVVNIFATNRRVHLYAQSYALSQDKPLVYLEPTLQPHCDMCFDNYRGIYVGQDMQVILTRNVSVRLKLCNGTRMYIRDFVYRKARVQNSPPDFITLEDISGSYPGLTLVPGRRIIPLFPCTDTIQCVHEADKKITVKYFPIQLAIALTTHKTQSMTLDKCVLHLAEYNLSYDRLLYLAVSRARHLKDIMLVGDGDLELYFPVHN